VTRPLFAGIDGGGTKTEVVVVNAVGREVSRVQSSASNAAVVGHDAAGAVLRDAVSRALQNLGPDARLEAAWFGLSGSDRPEDHRRLRPFVEDLAPTIRFTNDAELALGALPGSCGVVIVSGTGSIAFGRDATGTRARAGGWGQVIGDEGSGYDLARRMFAAYAWDVDGRGPSTSLTLRLTEHWSLAEPYQLIARVYAPAMTKGDIASLGRIVLEEAAAGDPVSSSLLDDAAKELADTAAAVARRLGFVTTLPLALTGSLVIHAEAFRTQVLAHLGETWPELSWQVVDDPALTAARFLARSVASREVLP
jgi:N-acetylglucosamine kinase-like BadF-type ATPase